MRLKYSSPGVADQVFSIVKPKFMLGAHRSSDLILKENNVAKKHCMFLQQKDGVYIEDLGSMSGTWVNGERIVVHGPLRDRDMISVGAVQIIVQGFEVSLSPTVHCPVNNLNVTQKLTENVHQELHRKVDTTTPTLGQTTPLTLDSSSEISHELVLHDSMEESTREKLELHWRQVIHTQLVEKMDLRRKNLHHMTDDQVHLETSTLIDEIFRARGQDIPETIAKEQLKQDIINEAIGLGPLESMLADNSITEIMVNSADQIFVESNGKLVLSGRRFSSDHAVRSVIDRIITPLGRRIDESSPMVDARLKDGSRVNAIIPPLAIKGACITIRKFSKKRLGFQDFIRFGSTNQAMVDFLTNCVQHKKNIIVSGGTGTGKTTLLNVLSNLIPDHERIVTVEDAAELQLNQPNLISLESRPPNIEGRGQVSIRDLVKNSLRMRPDRIVVGECRGGEALDMLQAMNTGHDGSLTTAHANSPRDILSRLEVMVLMAGIDLPLTAIREQIASAIQIIVQQTRFPCGARKITYITEVTGVESGTIQLQDIFVYKQTGVNAAGKVQGRFQATGFMPVFYEQLEQVGVPVDRSIFSNSGDLS